MLTSLFEEYYDRIARYAFSRIGNKSDAEDIAGDVFARAAESLHSYRDQGIPMQAWLFKIAHNLVVDHLRRKSKFKVVPVDSIEMTDNSDPAAAVETRMEIERVKTAMLNLTENQQEVLRLRFFGGLTSGEISVLMKKSDGAVREMQRAALEKLRQILGAG